ncbi:hypothetical protein GGI15_003086 [Coemansia interrupta]|uniref:RRM domain-containing protein n=1 Tax=Coemansia interrupta TaxID=1126814 RepID=A0A9W8HBB0_9FUNG|nr:hypothetical protein GGI15_003086 [Coemansia interrupta]
MDTHKFPKPNEFDADDRVRLELETGCHVFTDPDDGMEYEYDKAKGAWFPMWNATLVEQQQSAYGATSASQNRDCESSNVASSGAKAGKRKPRENTSIYVSGLPLDTTEAEVAEYFSQCGTIMVDILTNKPRIKLYRKENNEIKGDALVTYFKSPSVQLAVDILDDSQFRPTDPNRAQFEEKHESKDTETGALKRPKVDAKLVKKRVEQMQRKLDWTEEKRQIPERFARTVILEHMFTPDELEEDVTLLLDLAEDVRSECEKLGTIEAMIYDGLKRYKASKKNSTKTEAAQTELDNAGRTEGKDDLGDGNDDEQQRMEKYAQWLDSGH